ncbi:MAG: GAF domain-containing sensor histidine kinase [Candidatus Levybacteria bacterium]|nr:GAF domain-containing sensor histidine kinase [Candidatus Levybacteria bacterium]
MSQKTIVKIQRFLKKNADAIQKLATKHHKEFLRGEKSRTDLIEKYQKSHSRIIREIANNLDIKDLKRGTKLFQKIVEQFAHEAVQNGLTIEESVDGTIFLKQAIWKKMENGKLLKELTIEEYHKIHQVIDRYCYVVTSKIAFTYHREFQNIEGNQSYLAEASKILSSSLDYQTTLNTIATLAVPHTADWCAVDILDSDGVLQQVAIAHKNPKKIKWAKEFQKKRPTDMNAKTGVPNVLRTGKSELYPIITEEMLVAGARSKKELKLIRGIGFTSAMVVPIFSQIKPIGAITFVTAETNKHYNQGDLAMAQELGMRASMAIENARLYKGSQEAITLRDDFISVASHELKTPVTSVKMFTQVLKKHSEQIGDVKAVNHLSKMDKQLDKLTELIYDLLNISKIQAGRMEFRKELFNFDDAVKEVIDVLQQSATGHKIVIQGQTKKKIRGDEERIGQVINNLVSNAVKYSPKAKKVIVSLSSDKENVRVAVQDFGIGMEKAHLGKIFERFYRVYDTADKTFPGLGIGLYISSEIVKRHGGKVWVDSTIGKGSIFYVSLPIR